MYSIITMPKNYINIFPDVTNCNTVFVPELIESALTPYTFNPRAFRNTLGNWMRPWNGTEKKT